MTREQIQTLITDNITTNSNGEITAIKVKTILDAFATDYRHLSDEITLSQVTDLVSSLAGKQSTLTATNLKTIVDSLVEMTTPIDADKILSTDSSGTTAKKLSWTNVKAFLKTYFDGIYQAILISGTNIKTINGSSILGSGNLTAGLVNFSEAQNTSAPNTTVNVDSLTAVASTVNADISIVPKGTGAFQLAIPDSLTTGGNKRGTYAVDLQMVRSVNTQVSSGNYSINLGGSQNTSSGQYSITGGYNCTASGLYGIAIGQSCTATNQSSVSMGLRCKATGESALSIGGYFYSDSTASGQNSIIVGFGTASSSFSTVLGSGTCDAQYSTVIGYQGHAFGLTSKVSICTNVFTSAGDSQKGIARYGRRTTDATVSTLTSNNNPLVNQSTILGLQNQQMIRFKGTITGKQSGSINIGVWDIDGIIVRGANAGTTTLVGTPTITSISNLSGWGTPTITADTTNGALKIDVQGLAGTNIQWLAILDTTENLYL